MKKTFLNDVTSHSMRFGTFPVKEVLDNSVFYPAAGDDIDLICDINMNRRDWDVNSFVYCDYGESMRDFGKMFLLKGYHLIGERHLTKEELTPNGWILQLEQGFNLSKYWAAIEEKGAAKQYSASWMIFEKRSDFGEEYGPSRFSLLYICGEAVITYQALYWSNHCVPCAIAIMGVGLSHNWTHFCEKDKDLHWMVRNNPAGMPEYVLRGHASTTPTSIETDHNRIKFNWPEYRPMNPAVGYPNHEAYIFNLADLTVGCFVPNDNNQVAACHIDLPPRPINPSHFDVNRSIRKMGKISEESGWGYCMKDAVIFNAKDQNMVAHLESDFIRTRSTAECRKFYRDSRYIKYEILSQQLINQNEKWYDVIKVKVHLLMCKNGWELMEITWNSPDKVSDEGGYLVFDMEEPVRRPKYNREKYYISEIWFDVTQFHSNEQE